MAREVIEKLIDDLDGGDAAETVTFGLDGATYEIDLSKKNAAAFRKSLARYVSAARRSSTSARSTSPQGGAVDERLEVEARLRHPAAARVGRRQQGRRAHPGTDPELGGRAIQAGRRPLSAGPKPARTARRTASSKRRYKALAIVGGSVVI